MERVSAQCVAFGMPKQVVIEFTTVQTVLMVFSHRLLRSFIH